MEDESIKRETMEDSTSKSGVIKEVDVNGDLIATESTEQKAKEEEGGLLENLIINLTSPRASNPIEVDFLEGLDNQDEENEDLQEIGDEDGDSSRGGVIDTIVSHLPISIPENAAPTSDEASMLIHSVIHD